MCRKIRSQVAINQQIYQFPPAPYAARRRRTYLTRTAMARELIQHRSDPVMEIADNLGGRFGWTPGEKEAHLRRLTDIRLGQVEVAIFVRSLLPTGSSPGEIQELLDTIRMETDKIIRQTPSEDDWSKRDINNVEQL